MYIPEGGIPSQGGPMSPLNLSSLPPHQQAGVLQPVARLPDGFEGAQGYYDDAEMLSPEQRSELEQQRAAHYSSIGNEPTDPHQSQIRADDRIPVNIRSRIQKFETTGSRSSTPTLKHAGPLIDRQPTPLHLLNPSSLHSAAASTSGRQSAHSLSTLSLDSEMFHSGGAGSHGSALHNGDARSISERSVRFADRSRPVSHVTALSNSNPPPKSPLISFSVF